MPVNNAYLLDGSATFVNSKKCACLVVGYLVVARNPPFLKLYTIHRLTPSMLLSTGRHKGSRRPLPRREGSQPTARPRSPFHACDACLPILPLSISSADSCRTPGRLPHSAAQPGPSPLGPGYPPAPVPIVQRRAVKAPGGRRPSTGARRPARPAAPSATRRSKPPRSRASTRLRARERTHIRGRAGGAP